MALSNNQVFTPAEPPKQLPPAPTPVGPSVTRIDKKPQTHVQIGGAPPPMVLTKPVKK